MKRATRTARKAILALVAAMSVAVAFMFLYVRAEHVELGRASTGELAALLGFFLLPAASIVVLRLDSRAARLRAPGRRARE